MTDLFDDPRYEATTNGWKDLIIPGFDSNGYMLPNFVSVYGVQEWAKRGLLHRAEKDVYGYTLPACITTTYQVWYQNGKKHRTDIDNNGITLPAVIYNNGRKEWFPLFFLSC